MNTRRRSEFGVQVKIELVKLGMTSRELARAIGIADSTVCDVLAGRNTSEKTKKKICDVLERCKLEKEQKECEGRR